MPKAYIGSTTAIYTLMFGPLQHDAHMKPYRFWKLWEHKLRGRKGWPK